MRGEPYLYIVLSSTRDAGALYKVARYLLGRISNLPGLTKIFKNGVIFNEERYKRNAQCKGQRVKEALNNSIFRGLQSLLRHGDRNSTFSIENRVPFLLYQL